MCGCATHWREKLGCIDVGKLHCAGERASCGLVSTLGAQRTEEQQFTCPPTNALGGLAVLDLADFGDQRFFVGGELGVFLGHADGPRDFLERQLGIGCGIIVGDLVMAFLTLDGAVFVDLGFVGFQAAREDAA